MIARSFKSVVWVGATGAAALVCYIFSLQVAEERAGLAQLEAQIRRAEQSIRVLKTELGTRSRVHQLQHWSETDFGFASPTAVQFLPDEVTLASLDMPVEAVAPDAAVRTAQAPASAVGPSRPIQASAPAPARTPARPAVRQASATPTRPVVRQSSDAPGRPLLRQASVTSNSAAAARPRAARPAPAAPQAAPAARTARTLVDPATLRTIERRAAAERSGTAPRDERSR